MKFQISILSRADIAGIKIITGVAALFAVDRHFVCYKALIYTFQIEIEVTILCKISTFCLICSFICMNGFDSVWIFQFQRQNTCISIRNIIDDRQGVISDFSCDI